MPSLKQQSALVIGLGGLGCPAAWVLAQAGIGKLILLDDDRVDESNLGRQVLFGDADIGRLKVESAKTRLSALGLPSSQIETLNERLLPDNARRLAAEVDVVLEGADNFATKFLSADACRLEGVPIVHGAALRWQATVATFSPTGRPCYRCLFEDLPPSDSGVNCSSAGIMGPVAGFAGALMADSALQILQGVPSFGQVVSFDGKQDRLRRIKLNARADCSLCGPAPSILRVEEERYTRPICAA